MLAAKPMPALCNLGASQNRRTVACASISSPSEDAIVGKLGPCETVAQIGKGGGA
jgi:hypothetical protein